MKARMACAIAAFTAVMLTMATSSEAAGTSVRARFSFDAVANCEKPAVQNYPVHAEGTGMLSTDPRDPRHGVQCRGKGPV